MMYSNYFSFTMFWLSLQMATYVETDEEIEVLEEYAPEDLPVFMVDERGNCKNVTVKRQYTQAWKQYMARENVKARKKAKREQQKQKAVEK